MYLAVQLAVVAMIMLHLILVEWRREQLVYINSVCDGAERKAALCGLMEQEAELIASLGRHKIRANNEKKDKVMLDFLNKVSDISVI